METRRDARDGRRALHYASSGRDSGRIWQLFTADNVQKLLGSGQRQERWRNDRRTGLRELVRANTGGWPALIILMAVERLLRIRT
jgi:hypothetical protein